MTISTKAKTPNSFKRLIVDFKLSNPQDAFSIPYLTASETYVWSFHYRLLNFILFTNDKLFKIGLSDSDKYSFCGIYTEDLYKIFFKCSFVRVFWNINFTVWWSGLAFTEVLLNSTIPVTLFLPEFCSRHDNILLFLQRKMR